jgi:pimeloyl-ACP methyl ester carboxylesterase
MKLKLFLALFFLSSCMKTHAQQTLRRAFQPPNVVNKIPYGANAKIGKYAKTKDAKIYYEVYGKGQPIVVLHGGLFGSTVEMADFIDKLKQNYQVIAISLRGHGKSELGSEPVSLEQRAIDAMTVVNAITKDSIMVLGFSDGGFSAYKLASMYPARVKKMVVIGAGELHPGLVEFKFTGKDAMSFDKPFFEQQLKLMPNPNRLEDLFAGVNACYSKLTVGKDLLGNIKCPVLVMAGDKDDSNPVERIVKAARFIPKHQISIIPNTTHECFTENFNACWAAIEPFIKR